MVDEILAMVLDVILLGLSITLYYIYYINYINYIHDIHDIHLPQPVPSKQSFYKKYHILFLLFTVVVGIQLIIDFVLFCIVYHNYVIENRNTTYCTVVPLRIPFRIASLCITTGLIIMYYCRDL